MSHKLYIKTIIQPDARANLVLLHGFGFSHKIWLPIVHHLAAYNLYLVDLPGFGASELMDWETCKQALLAQLPAQFVVAGWSLGGLYATRLAGEAPGFVTHLINIASCPCFMHKENWPGVDSTIFDSICQSFVNNPQTAFAEFSRYQLRDRHGELQAYFEIPPVASLQHGLNILRDWDLRKLITTLTIPVYYMFGRLDSIVPVRVYEFMRVSYPNFHYILFPRAAHAPFLSEPENFWYEFVRLL